MKPINKVPDLVPTGVLLVKRQDLDTGIKEVERTAADMLGIETEKTRERIEREEKVLEETRRTLRPGPLNTVTGKSMSEVQTA